MLYIYSHRFIHTYTMTDAHLKTDWRDIWHQNDVCFLNTSNKCLFWFVSVVVRQCQWVCAGVWARKRDGNASSPVASKHATESEIPRVRVWLVGVKNSLRCLWLFEFPDTSSWVCTEYSRFLPPLYPKHFSMWVWQLTDHVHSDLDYRLLCLLGVPLLFLLEIARKKWRLGAFFSLSSRFHGDAPPPDTHTHTQHTHTTHTHTHISFRADEMPDSLSLSLSSSLSLDADAMYDSLSPTLPPFLPPSPPPPV
jgi:hypothetical protein